jgi:hypothetical protein
LEETEMRLQTISLAIFVCVTMIGVMPAAMAVCSNATLQGTYGYFHGRQGGNPSGTDMVVGQFTADGAGNLSAGSWTEAVSGGAISTGSFRGSYTISQTCTGTLKFGNEDNGHNIPAHYNIVLDQANHGFQMIENDKTANQPGFGLALATATCGLTGKKQTLATNFLGLNSSSLIEAMVGQFTLDGQGNISGTATFAIAGVISNVPVTGKYTQKSNCLGTAHVKPKGFSTMNFATVAVNGSTELLLIETDKGTYLAGTAQQ